MKTNKMLGALTGVALLAVLGSSAFAASIQITGNNNYRVGSGGEFTVQQVGVDSTFAAILADYRAAGTPPGQATRRVSGAGTTANPYVYGIETFCVETGENITLGATYDYQITDAAIRGGGTTANSSDTLSVGAGWLYGQFARGTLAGYNYTPGSGRAAQAGLLQNALWWLEGEAGGSQNAYTVAATSYFSSLGASSAKVDSFSLGGETITASTFGVQVMNLQVAGSSQLFNGSDRRQDQIIWNGGGRTDVPDGGITVMLLGIGLGGLALLRRKLS